MDYTAESLAFKVRKSLRYTRLYGVQRTLMKVRGQYHMKKNYDVLPAIDKTAAHEGRVGLIGCGNYAFTNTAFYLNKRKKGCIRACMDKNIARAASLYETFKLKYYTDNAEEIFSDPEIDLVFIGSNHASHAEYAIQAIRAGKHVHIEKPHVVNRDQIDRLILAMKDNPHVKVFLGFNRPRSKLFNELQAIIAREAGPLMINWFVAGHEIPDSHWYYEEAEGGRVLGNLCHWTDVSLRMVSLEKAFPCVIIPATPKNAKSDYVVSFIFGDRSCASITFSAKGHSFEGVREVLNLEKGGALAILNDFQQLIVDIREKRLRFSSRFRDHGHEANIVHSFDGTGEHGVPGEDPQLIKATGLLFLAVKDAIDNGNPVTLTAEDIAISSLEQQQKNPIAELTS